MPHRASFWATLPLSLLLVVGSARGEVQLPPFFSDHLVLQRESAAPIWGTAGPGEEVCVRFRGIEKKTTAGADGKWRVTFDGLEAGGPDELTVVGTNTLKLADVLVGEVWVGSGQSNMQMPVSSYVDNDPVLRKLRDGGPYPRIRLATANSSWQLASPSAIDKFSALLFSFGQSLSEELDLPVGLIVGAVGGSPSGGWISAEAFADDAACQKLVAAYAANYDAELKNFETKTLPAWKRIAEKLKAEGKPGPRAILRPSKPGTIHDKPPGYLHRVHILPIVGYGIRGVLWDQGESGTALGGVDQYTLMGALIRSWRQDWGQGDFPFIYIQKPSGGGCAWNNDDPVTSQGQPLTKLPSEVPSEASAQGGYVENHLRISSYPNVGMAISSDLGSGTHPVNKSGYGRRAATVALGMTYGKPIEYYGPIYASHRVEGNKVRVKFTHTDGGLAARHADKLQGFAIAGSDQKFVWADAEIDGDSVVVSSPQIEKPAAVRYAWARNHPWANLFNKRGLPALTFRTDDW